MSGSFWRKTIFAAVVDMMVDAASLPYFSAIWCKSWPIIRYEICCPRPRSGPWITASSFCIFGISSNINSVGNGPIFCPLAFVLLGLLANRKFDINSIKIPVMGFNAWASTMLMDRYTVTGFTLPSRGSRNPRRSEKWKSEWLVRLRTAALRNIPSPDRMVDKMDPRSLSGVLANWVNSKIARWAYAYWRASLTASVNKSFMGSAIMTIWSPWRRRFSISWAMRIWFAFSQSRIIDSDASRPRHASGMPAHVPM